MRPWLAVAFSIMLAAACHRPARADLPEKERDALAWYETLGYPNAKNLPYVRVTTGSWSQTGNQPPKHILTEGILVSQDAEAFTVFLCSVPDLHILDPLPEPYAPLTTVRFVHATTGPDQRRVDYEILDFQKVAAETLARIPNPRTGPFRGYAWPVYDRARIFAFGAMCWQKNLPETAASLMDIAAAIPNEATRKRDLHPLLDELQQQFGDAILEKAEKDWGNPAISWTEQLKAYEHFGARFPANNHIAYAQEAADLIHKMIAEAAAHHPKPLKRMSPAEQAAENIYQLRFFHARHPVINTNGPLSVSTQNGEDLDTPVPRLIALGDRAIPQLSEALNDRRFTRTTWPRMSGVIPPRIMRIGDFARETLDYLDARDRDERRMNADKLLHGTILRKAEAWWAEAETEGEDRVMAGVAVAGGIALLLLRRWRVWKGRGMKVEG